MRAVIRGTGSSLPERVLTNQELEKLCDTTDEWIVTRTGIRERRVLEPERATSDMAAEAAQNALEMAGLTPDQLDLIVCATLTPDTLTPSTANRVQGALRVGRTIPSFDINAACSGFLYGLEAVNEMMAGGRYRRVLLIGAETMTRFMDYQERAVCVLFGDAAGAMVLEASDDPAEGGIEATVLKSDPAFSDLIQIPGGGSARPPSPYMLTQREAFLRMDGPQVFKLAVQSLEQVARDTAEQAGWKLDEVDHFVMHQANRRILSAVSDRLEIPDHKRPTNLHRAGNTSAASIPLLIDECQRGGRFRPGDKIISVAFGAGLTWAGAALSWTLEPGVY